MAGNGNGEPGSRPNTKPGSRPNTKPGSRVGITRASRKAGRRRQARKPSGDGEPRSQAAASRKAKRRWQARKPGYNSKPESWASYEARRYKKLGGGGKLGGQVAAKLGSASTIIPLRISLRILTGIQYRTVGSIAQNRTQVRKDPCGWR